jgi:enamine deaminase RidA (YjgF/YER057c/UK114 family)
MKTHRLFGISFQYNDQNPKFDNPLKTREKDMAITRMETKQRMSRIVIHNDTIYLCGQVAEDAEKGIQEQTRTMLDKVDVLLEQAGSDRKHILSATIYLKNMDLFTEMNEIWDKWVPEGYAPARACVEASMAREELLVEISVIAAVKTH